MTTTEEEQMAQENVPVQVIDGEIVVQENVDLTKQPKNVKIIWQMQTDGWVFTDQGIVITNPGEQFSEPTRTANGRAFHWKDKNDDGKQYKYSIYVAPEKGGDGIELDPGITNGGGGGGGGGG